MKLVLETLRAIAWTGFSLSLAAVALSVVGLFVAVPLAVAGGPDTMLWVCLGTAAISLVGLLPVFGVAVTILTGKNPFDQSRQKEAD